MLSLRGIAPQTRMVWRCAGDAPENPCGLGPYRGPYRGPYMGPASPEAENAKVIKWVYLP